MTPPTTVPDVGALMPAAIAAIAALLGVTLAWGLNQLSTLVSLRRERRAQLNAALAELLEIRHLFLVQPKATDPVGAGLGFLDPAQLQQLGPLPHEAQEAVSRWLTQIVPGSAPAEERFAAAVGELAKVDPELSYRLRHQSLPLKLEVALASFATAAGAPRGQVAAVQQAFAREIGPDLDDAILQVARRTGGVVGWWRIRRLLKNTPPSDDRAREEFQRFMKAMALALPQLTTSTAQPPRESTTEGPGPRAT